MTYTCDQTLASLDDRLDDLLDPTEQDAFDVHVDTCAACRRAQDQASARREVLYRPYAVDAVPTDLRTRIEASAATHRPSRRGLFLRYAASFAAGVLVTLALTAGAPPASSIPGLGGASRGDAQAPNEATPSSHAPAPEASPPSTPLRRIR